MSNLEIAKEARKAAMKELDRVLSDRRFGKAKRHAVIPAANEADERYIAAKHAAEAQ